ncbi:MAG: hypothetical protein PSN04_06840 [Methyloprofundus sp.]|nr:hypothetical protein [Methyloprofundus sp.]
MKKCIFMTLIFNILLSTAALAECTYDGEKHPEGTVIGPYTCSDGKWVFK